jgi:hypothetical protein
MANLLAANGGIFAAKTETTPNTWNAPTGVDVVNVVGTPSFKVRGAGVIGRADLYTDRGGGQVPVRGGVGWDITFQTELYLVDLQGSGPTFNDNPLHALFRACMVNVDENTNDVTLTSTAQMAVAAAATPAVRSPSYAVQPCSMQWQQLDGRIFQAKGCVGTFKISGQAGQKVLIDWTFKGQWQSIPQNSNVLTAITSPDYTKQQAPVIFAGWSLTLNLTLGDTLSVDLASFEYTQGVTLSDIPDALATYGFGVSALAFDNYPQLVIDVASQPENVQSTWTDAFSVLPANATSPIPTMTLSYTAAPVLFSIVLRDPKQLAMPEESEANTVRRQKLTFVGLATGTADTDQASQITFA